MLFAPVFVGKRRRCTHARVYTETQRNARLVKSPDVRVPCFNYEVHPDSVRAQEIPCHICESVVKRTRISLHGVEEAAYVGNISSRQWQHDSASDSARRPPQRPSRSRCSVTHVLKVKPQRQKPGIFVGANATYSFRVRALGDVECWEKLTRHGKQVHKM